MPFIKAVDRTVFRNPRAQRQGRAAPSLGSAETCVWQITLAPGHTRNASFRSIAKRSSSASPAKRA